MKKSKIRVIGAIVCSLIVTASLSGCKKKTEVGTETNAAKKEPLTITMVHRLDAAFVSENNPVIKLLEEKANVKLKLEVPPVTDYVNRVNVLMASGDLPDLIHLQNIDAKYQEYAADGMLIPLDDYFKNTPNINKRTLPEQLEQARVEKTGKLHSVPRPHESSTFIALYRKDWFDALELKAPQTIEEFEKVAIAIAKGDPDKNGKADTYFMSLLPSIESEQLLSGAFGVRDGLTPDANGKVTIAEGQEGFIKLMDFYRKLYAEKAIDPEWYLNKTYGDRDKFKRGKLAMMTNAAKPNELVGVTVKDLVKAFPNAKIDYFLPLKDATGKRPVYLSPSTWGAFAISNTAKDPKRIMEFLDWTFSDEGIEVLNAGVKGVTYESFDINTGICISPESMLDARTKYISPYMSFITSVKGKRIMTPGNTDSERKTVSVAVEDYYKNVNIVNTVPSSFAPGFTDAEKKLTDIKNTRDQYVAKYIIGQISRDEFVKFLNEKFLPANKEVIGALQKYYDTKMKK
jgi:ABC-type glycerol-3-phosphate transport system substrate-binding protein